MRHYDFKIKFLRNYHSNVRRIDFSVKRIAESNVENAQNNVEKSESHIHFLISISDSKDNIAEDTLVHVHFNKIHMKPFVKPRKQSIRLRTAIWYCKVLLFRWWDILGEIQNPVLKFLEH